MKILRTTYLSLGSNQGAKLKNLQKAINLIAEKIGTVTKISSVYKTASWGFKSDDFYNICIELSTGLNPEDLLTFAQSHQSYLVAFALHDLQTQQIEPLHVLCDLYLHLKSHFAF